MNLIKGANMDNKTTIQNMINDRVSKNETTNCLFQILLLNKSVKEELESLLLRNGYSIEIVDTVEGCYNLNDDWYELSNVEAIVEYSGVYPVKWDIDDIVLLDKLYYDRAIYINVLWKKKNPDGSIKYIPNN